ncbi:hypothetical protein VTG60DRAFT_3950 [Thermothelomyces hinnuleus]
MASQTKSIPPRLYIHPAITILPSNNNMSHEIHPQWQCSYCQAYFNSKHLLQEHFAEYQSRVAELERYRAHANAYEDFEHALGNKDDETLDAIPRHTRCPYPGCHRSEPFKTGQQLRVHFQIHIPCEEVCVCCFKVIRRASEYIRHSREHVNISETKRRYTAQTCHELRGLVSKKLKECLEEAAKTCSKKRTWEEVALDPEMGACDARLNGVMMTASSSYLPINVVPLPETAPASAPLPEVARLPIQPHRRLEEPISGLDDDAFDPASTYLNFPQRWMLDGFTPVTQVTDPRN